MCRPKVRMRTGGTIVPMSHAFPTPLRAAVAATALLAACAAWPTGALAQKPQANGRPAAVTPVRGSVP